MSTSTGSLGADSEAISTTSTTATTKSTTTTTTTDGENEKTNNKKSTKRDVDETNPAESDDTTIDYEPIDYHWFYSIARKQETATTEAAKNDNENREASGGQGQRQDKTTETWLPMSRVDSKNLETIYVKHQNSIEKATTTKKDEIDISELFVLVKGGRFEVNLVEMRLEPVYWTTTCKNSESRVRRSLWFYKESDQGATGYTPYKQEYSTFLESEYEKTIRTCLFHKRIDYTKIVELKPNPSKDSSSLTRAESIVVEEAFVFHSQWVMLHFTQANQLDEFGNLNSDAKRPRIVKRGMADVCEVDKIEPDETAPVDHVCFVVHGIGEGCDMRFRPIVDCVDDLREIGEEINKSHGLKSRGTSDGGSGGRVEFLPISWHEELHGNPTGLDERLKNITLPSIPKLRDYSNSTIMDVLFYTSPVYCQNIIARVGNELNRLHTIFMKRNPNFKGEISLIGHSLGSIILFDLMSHQKKKKNETENKNTEEEEEEDDEKDHILTVDQLLDRFELKEFEEAFKKEKITIESLRLMEDKDLAQLGLPLGPRKLILEEIKTNFLRNEMYQAKHKVQAGLEQQKESSDCFKYGLTGSGQLVIKYPQLNFSVKNLFALGSPIAAFLIVRGIKKIDAKFSLPTCEKFFHIFHPYDPIAYRIEPFLCSSPILEPVIIPHHKGRKRMHLELKDGFEEVSKHMVANVKNAWSSLTWSSALSAISAPGTTTTTADQEHDQKENEPILTTAQPVSSSDLSRNEENDQIKQEEAKKVKMGELNKGRRIDYQLQESPFESFNEYLFALASHACYWESEDTILLMLKEIYDVEYSIDSSTAELPQQQKQQQTQSSVASSFSTSSSSWLGQMATDSFKSNLQKTFSNFKLN